MRRTARAGIAVSALALLLSACGGGGDDEGDGDSGGGSGESPAASGELIIWADNSANTAKAIEPLCKSWAEANGVTCTVKKFNGQDPLDEQLRRGNNTGDVPDIFEGPHDRIGGYVRDGLIAPVDLGDKAEGLEPASITAVTYEGKTYGVPWAMENIALLTNKTLAPECPATLDDAVANAKNLISQGKATKGLGIALQIGELGDAYHWYPLLTADGGYSFGANADGTMNPDDLGIDSPGAIAAGKRLQQLVADGILKASVSYDIARESFAKGKSPYFISGPWQVPEQQAALGDNLMICPIPTWKGSDHEATPFLGVRTFMLTNKSPNAVLAQTFLNDTALTTEFMDGMYSVDPRPPAWIESYDKAASDPIIKGFGDYGKTGVPMGNIAEFAAFMANAGQAQYKIATGGDPATVLKQTAKAIDKQNAALE